MSAAARRRCADAGCGVQAPLDGGNHELADVDAELLVELADPGGARDVDLGHEAADDVEADQQHAPGTECRADLPGEPAVAVVERPADAARTGGKVAAVIFGGRDARQCV